MSKMKLQKFLQQLGYARRKAGELVKSGKVKVNGSVVFEPWFLVKPGDRVEIGGKVYEVSPSENKRYLVLHKPAGYLTTRYDPRGRPTIFDLIDDPTLFPVGRLDKDTEGVLVLTNDGDLANRLMHPRYQVERIYHALVVGIPSQKDLSKLIEGIEIWKGQFGRAKKTRIIEKFKDKSWVEVVMTEGKKREVRRLLEAVGHPVIRLIRVAYGPVDLTLVPVPGMIAEIPEKMLEELKKL